MRLGTLMLLCGAIAFPRAAAALDFSFEGYVDLRLVVPAGEKSWLDGGLGKFRFGAGQPSPNLRLTEAVGAKTRFQAALHIGHRGWTS